MPHLGLPVVHK